MICIFMNEIQVFFWVGLVEFRGALECKILEELGNIILNLIDTSIKNQSLYQCQSTPGPYQFYH